MSVELDDDLVLSYDDGFEDGTADSEPTVYPAVTEAIEAVGPENDVEAEKAPRTKAYKLAAPAGSLFGRLAKVGSGGAAHF